MKFDRFIAESKHSSQQDQVGLALYYFEHEEEKDQVRSREVKDLFKESRVSIPERNVPTNLSRLSDDDLLKYEGSAQYREYKLSLKGLRKFSELAAPLDQEEEKEREDLFIPIEDIDVDYYSKLVDGINKSYRYGINDGTLVLTRKLFENLVIDILRAEYGGQGINLYYNTETGRFHGLGTLCGKLEEKSSDLKHYSRQLDNGLVARVEQFKEHGNSQAHSVRVNIDDDELEAMSVEATELAKTLYDIREEVRIANG
ncbi:hypothetical protein [Natronorubrum sp. DTA28]|uniref:hypothetical protein n=1 Tax=Natronorubrum sp. DTA28 TaxID=3447019 RepID=UPI003F865CF0